MTAIRINHINIRSSAERIETLRVFYCQALGLSEGHRPNFGSHGYWLYASNQALIHLSITGIDEHRGTHVDNTLDHIAFDCENRTATCENLTRMGVEFTVDRVPDTPIVQIFFRDPAGNGIELSFSES